MLDDKGQVTGKAVIGGVVIFIIAMLIGSLLISEFYGTSRETAEGTRPTYLDNSKNTDFSAKLATGKPFGWENTNQYSVTADNAPKGLYDSSNKWIYVERTDMAENTVVWDVENHRWYTTVTVASIHQGVSSAKLAGKYRVIENENAQSIQIVVKLERPGGDNITFFQTDNLASKKSTSWTSFENLIPLSINAAGTYKVWLETRIAPQIGNGTDGRGCGANQPASRTQVAYDDVTLEITSYDKESPETALTNTGSSIPTVWKLAVILLVIIVGSAIMKALGVF